MGVYLEEGHVIESENGKFMIVSDDEAYLFLIDLIYGSVIASAWNPNNFRRTIGNVIRQYKIK